MSAYKGGFVTTIPMPPNSSITGITVSAPCIPVYDNIVVQGEVVTTTDGDWVRQQTDCIAQQITATPVTTAPGVIVPGTPEVPPIIGPVDVPYVPPGTGIIPPGAEIPVDLKTSVETFLDFAGGNVAFMHKVVTDITNYDAPVHPKKYIGYWSTNGGLTFTKLPNYILPISKDKRNIAFRESDGMALSFFAEQAVIESSPNIYMVKLKVGEVPVYTTEGWPYQKYPAYLTCDGTYFYAISSDGFVYRTADGDSWVSMAQFTLIGTPPTTYVNYPGGGTDREGAFLQWNSLGSRWWGRAWYVQDLHKTASALLNSGWVDGSGLPAATSVYSDTYLSNIITTYFFNISTARIAIVGSVAYLSGFKRVAITRLGIWSDAACIFRSTDSGLTWSVCLELLPFDMFDQIGAKGNFNGIMKHGSYAVAIAINSINVTYRTNDNGVTWAQITNDLGPHDITSEVTTGTRVIVLSTDIGKEGVPYYTDNLANFLPSTVVN